MILLALALALPQAPPVFRGDVERVYVDAFVTQQEAPVLGLTADDFVVSDNGVAQRVTLMDLETRPFSVVLAFDVSASVSGEKLEKLRAAANTFLSRLGRGEEAALVTFNEKIELRQQPTSDREALRRALAGVTPRGPSALFDTLFLCFKKSWGRGRPLIVLFTDGDDTASWIGNDELLLAAGESTGLLQVVGTRDRPPLSGGAGPRTLLMGQWFEGQTKELPEPGYVRLLRQAAEMTGGAFWWADSGALDEAFLRILRVLSARYVLAYDPLGVPREGRHQLKVSVKRPDVQVRARHEYFVPASRRR